jgi:hypothetical protein
VSGITAKRDRVKAAGRRKANQDVTRQTRRKASILLTEMQTLDAFLLPTGIMNGGDIDFEDDCDEVINGSDVISPEFMPPEVEYWSQASRKTRSKAATAARVTKHRKKTLGEAQLELSSLREAKQDEDSGSRGDPT